MALTFERILSREDATKAGIADAAAAYLSGGGELARVHALMARWRNEEWDDPETRWHYVEVYACLLMMDTEHEFVTEKGFREAVGEAWETGAEAVQSWDMIANAMLRLGTQDEDLLATIFWALVDRGVGVSPNSLIRLADVRKLRDDPRFAELMSKIVSLPA